MLRWIVIVLFLLLPSAARADLWADCEQSEPYGRRIQLCTEFIQRQKGDPRLASAYANRGRAYSAMGEYDLAIADYTRAIEVYLRGSTPTLAGSRAYLNRGYVYRTEKKEFEKAIADYTKVIEILPK